MIVRAATESDVPALSALATRTFVETFVDELGVPYPQDDLAHHLEKSYGVAATRALIEDPTLFLRVAEREPEGALVGYVLAGSCGLPHAEADATQGELRRLYVAHEAHGGGIGGALLREALVWLERTFGDPIWLGVWSGNHRAQAIYQRYGFHKVGEYDYPVGQWLDREHIYRREHAPALTR